LNIFYEILYSVKTRLETETYFETVSINNDFDEVDNIKMPALFLNLGRGDTEETIAESVHLHYQEITIRCVDKAKKSENLNVLVSDLLARVLQILNTNSWTTFVSDIHPSILSVKYTDHSRPVIDNKNRAVSLNISYRVYFHNNFTSYLGA
jgi:hypothetical protein